MPNSSIIPPNRIKRALKEGQSVVGTMVVEIRQPAVMQLLANAGFDFAIIDNEHGAFNIETIADLSRTAVQVGVTPLVRIPDLTYPHIAQTLDAGAQGIMLPRVTNVEQVREAVQFMKYPPMGIRGSALSRGYTNFKSAPVDQAMAEVDQETMLVVQIETRQAVENMEEIITVPGVDVALIGPNDLSIAHNVPGQINGPEVRSIIESTIAICQKHDVIPAIHINEVDLAVSWAKQGMRLISSGSEAGLLMWRGREVTSTIGGAFGR